MKETDIDRLRSQWKNLDLNLADLDQHTREVADALSRNRTIGMRQRLRRRFMLAIVGCCLCPLWLFGTAQLQLSWSFRIVYAMFFVAMALLNYLQYRALGRIDIVKSTVGDALQSVFRFKVLRRRCKLTGCMLAAPLLVWLFIHIYNIGHAPIIAGAWSGLVLGLAAGIYFDYRSRKLLRDMRSVLESMLQ